MDNAARRLILTTGGSSSWDSHPTGGDAGGDIRNVRWFSGGSKNRLEFLILIGYSTQINSK